MSESNPGRSKDDVQPIGTTYFMVRVQRPLGQPSDLFTGAIERLGTGEKRQFGSEEELLALLRSWPADPPNMQNHGDLSKPPAALARPEPGGGQR